MSRHARPRRVARVAKAVVAATLVVFAAVVVARYVAADDSPPASEASDSTARSQASRASRSTSAVQLDRLRAKHPQAGDCHALGARRVQRPHDNRDPVPCRKDHTTQTYYVGTFDLDIIGDRNPATADIAEFVTPRCVRQFKRWVGGDRVTRLLARVHPIWFVPSDHDIKLGARWFRCDLVVAATDSRLDRLPRDTEGLLDSDSALARYGMCSRGSPERAHATLVICDRRHTWRAFTALRVGDRGSGDFPDRQQRREARRRCVDRAREELDFPLEWTYGWQPPTRTQWAAGLRWGLCWVPSA